MPRPISSIKEETIVACLASGFDIVSTSEQLGVSYNTVWRVKRNLKTWGQSRPPPLSRPGPLPRLTEGMIDDLEVFVKENPDWFLREMRQFLLDTHDVEVNITTISMALKARGLTHKKLKRPAAQRCPILRDAWVVNLISWRGSQMVFLDESAINEATSYRRNGWAPSGQPAEQSTTLRRTERYSVLPAYALEDYITWMIVQGSVTAELYEDFVKNKVLPLMNEYPGSRSILVMDNASIHRSQAIKEMCAQAAVQLTFLPPYSPDYNPIEQSFAQLKAWMRSNSHLAAGMPMESFIELAIATFNLEPGNHFRSANIII